MSEVCGPNEKEPCQTPNPVAESPWLTETPQPDSTHTAPTTSTPEAQIGSKGVGYETGSPPGGTALSNSADSGDGSKTLTLNNKGQDSASSQILDTDQANRLLDQAWDMVVHNNQALGSANYEQLLRQAMVSADYQFNTDKAQYLTSKLPDDQRASVMSRIYLAEALRAQNKNEDAEKLIHEAISTFDGTPKEIMEAAQKKQADLIKEGKSPPEALKETWRIWNMSVITSDIASKYAFDKLEHYSTESSTKLPSEEKDRLVELAMSSVETRLYYGIHTYNESQDVTTAKGHIEDAQNKLSEISESLEPIVTPGLVADMVEWQNPLQYVSQDFVPGIKKDNTLITGTLNQISSGDPINNYDSVVAAANNLSPKQELVCSSAAMTGSFLIGVGAAALDTPETFGVATIPTYLLFRSTLGSGIYNLCRGFYGKTITPKSVAWGATYGLIGGTERYAVNAAEASTGLKRAAQLVVPGSWLYSYALTEKNYYDGRINSWVEFRKDLESNLGYSTMFGLGMTYPLFGAPGLILRGDMGPPAKPKANK